MAKRPGSVNLLRRIPKLCHTTARDGLPLVHGRTNAVPPWRSRFRTQIGEKPKTPSGFYVLRHLGETQFGSRQGKP